MYVADPDAVAVSADIASATKAAPAVVTFDTAVPVGTVVGSVLIPRNTGWKSLDDKPFRVSNVAGLNITLEKSDTSDEIPDLDAAASADLAQWVEFCMATLTFTSPPGNDIDVTTLCDDERETVAGMPAPSTWAATGFWDADDTVQDMLEALKRSGDKTTYQALFRDGSGLIFLATTTSFDVAAGVDQAVTLNTGGTVSGGIRKIPKPA
jgi:hypothetical protein